MSYFLILAKASSHCKSGVIHVDRRYFVISDKLHKVCTSVFLTDIFLIVGTWIFRKINKKYFLKIL